MKIMPPLTASSTNTIEIRFVDDEMVQLDLIREYFEGIDKINAKYTTNATEAMGWVLREHVDVLVFDMNLEGEYNGIDFLEQARQINQDIKLILFTGYFVANDKFFRCQRIGAQVVRKQQGKVILYDTIQKMLGIEDVEENRFLEEENLEYKKMFLTLAAPLIQELEQMEKENLKIKIDVSDRSFSPASLLKEIKGMKPIGRKVVEDYFYSLSIYKRINPKKQ